MEKQAIKIGHVETKSVMTKSNAPLGGYSVNPYVGCPHVAQSRDILRGVLRHEFRHHIEFLGGIHNSSSLEAEDARKKQEYLDRHER